MTSIREPDKNRQLSVQLGIAARRRATSLALPATAPFSLLPACIASFRWPGVPVRNPSHYLCQTESNHRRCR